MELWRPPDPESWRKIADPRKRLRVALGELYAFYGRAGAGIAVIIRDAPLLPRELADLPGPGDRLRAAPGVLVEGWEASGRVLARLTAAIVHATAVATWQSLVQRGGLSDAEAVSLLQCMVECAAEEVRSGS
jgi:hypothetical protein